MNKEVKVPLRHVVVVMFRCGDGVRKGIREVKRADKKEAQGPFISHNMCQMWQGIWNFNNSKSNNTTMVEGDAART